MTITTTLNIHHRHSIMHTLCTWISPQVTTVDGDTCSKVDTPGLLVSISVQRLDSNQSRRSAGRNSIDGRLRRQFTQMHLVTDQLNTSFKNLCRIISIIFITKSQNHTSAHARLRPVPPMKWSHNPTGSTPSISTCSEQCQWYGMVWYGKCRFI